MSAFAKRTENLHRNLHDAIYLLDTFPNQNADLTHHYQSPHITISTNQQTLPRSKQQPSSPITTDHLASFPITPSITTLLSSLSPQKSYLSPTEIGLTQDSYFTKTINF
ncbi:hypothetical protein E2C01_031576 [Portunus trituberculatus]|uniref:Uncharacterized protein n=1 Tax=Portunus trituberculatus TaxID=210409 RepID=A0A5B7EX82_PORTR|nr:hypothetical protein [Portunus trituberculatus]